jgi:hypothetical protein
MLIMGCDKLNLSRLHIDSLYGFCFVLVSLYSFYFYGISVLTILGLISLIFLRLAVGREMYFRDFSVLFPFLFVFLYSVFGVVFFSVDFDYKRIAGFSLLLLMLFFLSCVRGEFSAKKSISLFLSVHVFFFLIQFVAYYMAGIYVDYFSFIGLESRNFGGSFSLPFFSGFMRASGLFNEPGTYACFMAPMISIFYRYVDSRKDYFVFTLALFTLILSFSTFGLLFFVLIVFFLVSSLIIKTISVFLICFLGFPYFYWKYFSSLSNMTNVEGFLWGRGGFNSEGFAFSQGGADNDSGLFFYVLQNFGGFSFVFFMVVLLFLLSRTDKPGALAVLILLMSKVSFFSLAFPLYLFLALRWGKDKF